MAAAVGATLYAIITTSGAVADEAAKVLLPTTTQSNTPQSGNNSASGLLADRAMLARLAQGTMAKFRFADAAQLLPQIELTNADGARHMLSEWRGRFVLLNVWASWCAPCREEMPSLQRLAGVLGKNAPVVALLSIDKSPAAAEEFLRQINVTELASFRDPDLSTSRQLGVRGAPTTLLIDPLGQEIGRIEGAAHWDAEEALLLLKAVTMRWQP